MNPAAYWRDQKNWHNWLGKKGTVIASTTIRVASPGQESYLPYSFAIVDFGDQKHEWMGVGHQKLATGDKVICVLRKLSQSKPHELIEYGIKVQKCQE